VVGYVYNLAVGAGLAALLLAWYATWFFVVPVVLRRRSAHRAGPGPAADHTGYPNESYRDLLWLSFGWHSNHGHFNRGVTFFAERGSWGSAATARVVALVGALPRELDARPAITIRVAAVEFSRHRDEAQFAETVLIELDETGLHQVDGLLIPVAHTL
jgi:hypothetical protein